jgi:hypothetical protein
MNACHLCGIPWDAGFFDESRIVQIGQEPQSRLNPGDELVLARYELHRNYCGTLLYFAQHTDKYPAEIRTPGYQWQIRCNGQPRDPYLTFDHIINPWGLSGFPVFLRLEEGCLVEFVVRNVSAAGPPNQLVQVGGRILGRYWYNETYGGVPNSL